MSEEKIIVMDFDEHQAMLYEVRPGWNFIDCAGDSNLQKHYLEDGLVKDDYQAWNEGVLTDHCLELLNDTGLDVENVIIKYSYEHRRYEIEIVERIGIQLSGSGLEIPVSSFSCR
jgi:hypothetical protein